MNNFNNSNNNSGRRQDAVDGGSIDIVRGEVFSHNSGVGFGGTSASGTNMSSNTTSRDSIKDSNIAQMLASLHLEWRQHEMDRNRWVADKAEYEAKIGLLEGRLKAYASANVDLLQRIKMLEAALLTARSQEKFGNDGGVVPGSPQQQQPPTHKLAHTQEQSKRGFHLLQKYLKEVKLIEDTIKNKESYKSSIGMARRLSESNASNEVPKDITRSIVSNLTGKNKMSPEEQTRFISDMRKSYYMHAQERSLNDQGTIQLLSGENIVYLPTKQSSYEKKEKKLESQIGGFSAASSKPSRLTDSRSNDDSAFMFTGSRLHESGVKRSPKSRFSIHNYLNDTDDDTTISISKRPMEPPLPYNYSFAKEGADQSSRSPTGSVESTTATSFPSIDRDADASFELKLDQLSKQFNMAGAAETSSDTSSIGGQSKTDTAELFPPSSSGGDSSLMDDELSFLDDLKSVLSEDAKSDSGGDSSLPRDDSQNCAEFETLISTKTHKVTNKHWTELGVFRGHTDMLTDAAFHPTNEIIASTSFDGIVCLWSYKQLQKNNSNLLPMSILRGHESPVLTCLFDVSGDCLYTADSQGDIIVWNAATGADFSQLKHYKSSKQQAVWSLSHHHSTNSLLSAAADGVCSFWKPDSIVPISVFTVPDAQHGVVSAEFLPADPTKVIVASGDTIHLYDAHKDAPIFSLKLESTDFTPTKSSTNGLVQSACAHPTQYLYATGWGHRQVKIADVRSRDFVFDFIAHPTPITSLCFGSSHCNTFLASGGANGSVRLWDPSYSCYSDLTQHRPKHNSGVTVLKFHPSTTHMLSGGADELLKLYI